jgi:O-antigen/teichoic acid export membrane protein
MVNKLKTLIKKKFVIDFLWNLLAFTIVALCVTVLNVVVGNTYGAEGLGLFNYAYTLFVVLSTISVFGVKNSAVKYISEKGSEENIAPIVVSSLIIVLVISLAVVLLSLALANFIVFSTIMNFSSLVSILLALPIFSFNEVQMGVLNGLRKMTLYAIFRTLRWFLILVFVIYTIFTSGDVEFSLYAFAFSEVCLFLILLLNNRKYLKLNMFNKKWLYKHYSFGIRAMFTQVSNQLDNKLPLLILGIYAASSDVGIYSFANTVLTGLIMIPSVVALNFNPLISKLWETNKISLVEKMHLLRRGVLLVILPSYLISALFYPIFIRYFMNNKIYEQSIGIFYILIIATTVLSTAVWKNGFFQMIGKPDIQLKIKVTILMINLFLSLVLIKYFGLTGAAVSTLIVSVLYSLILTTAIKREFNISIKNA